MAERHLRLQAPPAADVAAADWWAADEPVETRQEPLRGLAWLLLVGGVIGLLSAFTLTVERFALAEKPAYVPSCSINPVLSCGSVMVTEQAALFGFPNPLLGRVL